MMRIWMFTLCGFVALMSQSFESEVAKYDLRSKSANIPGVTKANVLVIYNKNYSVDENKNNIQDSYEIALYYKEKRNLNDVQILGIDAGISEEVTYAQYDAAYDKESKSLNIRQQVEDYLNHTTDQNGHILKYKIRFIALCKGIPLKIKEMNSTAYNLADYSSVDASLTLMFNEKYDKKWGLKNSYFQKDPYGFQLSSNGGFKGFENPLKDSEGNTYTLNYLVSRLDAYSLGDVFAMIDRSVNAPKAVVAGDFLIDDHPDKSYDQMPVTASWLKYPSLGYSVSYNSDNVFVYENKNPVIFYTSHGIHAGMPDGYINNFKFKIADGAAFTTYESFNGYGFKNPSQSSHGQVAEWIAKGGTVGIGNVYEPWSSNIARELHLSFTYGAGYHWAEAAYQSLANIDFVSTIIGDPLTQIRDVNFVDDGSFTPLKLMSTYPKNGETVSNKSTIMFEFNKKISSKPTLNNDDFDVFVKSNKVFLISKTELSSSVTINLDNLVSDDNSKLSNVSLTFNTSSTDNKKLKVLYTSLYEKEKTIDPHDTLQFIFSKKINSELVASANTNTEISGSTEGKHFIHLSIKSKVSDNYVLNLSSSELLYNYKYHIKVSNKVFYSSISYDFDNDGNEEKLEDRDYNPDNGFEYYLDEDSAISSIKLNEKLLTEHTQNIIVETGNNAFLYGVNENKVIVTYPLLIINNNGKKIYHLDYDGDHFKERYIDLNLKNKVNLIPLDTIETSFNRKDSIGLQDKLSITFSQVLTENLAKEQIRFIPNVTFSVNRIALNKIEIQPGTTFKADTEYKIYINQSFKDYYQQDLVQNTELSFKTIPISNQKIPLISESKIENGQAVLKWLSNSKNVDVYKSSNIYFNTTGQQAYSSINSNEFTDKILDSMQVYKLFNHKESAFSSEVYVKKERHSAKESGLNRFQLELPGFEGMVSKLASYIPGLKSVSVWSNDDQSWKEASYINNIGYWVNDFFINFGTPIQVTAESDINSFIISNIKDTVKYQVSASINNYKDHAFIHLGNSITISDLFKDQKNIIAVAVWDNEKQEWNESSYISLFDKWINDQTLRKGQSYYVKSKSDLEIVYILGNHELRETGRKKSASNFNLIADGQRSFNSINMIFQGFPGLKITIYDSETEQSIESTVQNDGIAFINIGNFDSGWFIDKEYQVEYELHGEIFDRKFVKFNGDIINYDFSGELPKIKTFKLNQNYPNPFNPSTNISFEVKPGNDIYITIYNILGQKIKEFFFHKSQQSKYQIMWNGDNQRGNRVSSGIYFYELRSGNYSDRRKMIMIK